MNIAKTGGFVCVAQDNLEASAQHSSAALLSWDEIKLEAMQLSFPVVEQLVGKQAFRQLVKQFLALKSESQITAHNFSYSSYGKSLDQLGDKFANFLLSEQLHQRYPLAQPLAALEWRLHSMAISSVDTCSGAKTGTLNGFRFWLKRSLSSSEQLKLKLSANTFVYRSYSGEVAYWLSRKLSQSTALHSDTAMMSHYWMVQRNASGFGFTPLNRQQFLFYSQIQAQPSVADLSKRFGKMVTAEFLYNREFSPVTQVV